MYSSEIRKELRYAHRFGEMLFVAALLILGLYARLLIAPYTSHGYDVYVHRAWLFRLLKTNLFFYLPSEGMGLFGESWGHDPAFCELPPIYPFTLFVVGKVYAFLQPRLEDVYLLVLFMKIPQIIAECSIAVLIFHMLRKETNLRLGALAALIFLANPFTFFCTAVWGAPESLVAFFVLTSLYAAYRSRPFLASWLLGVSIMVKPYAMVFLIPVTLFSYPDLKFLRTVALPLTTALSAAVTALPWLIAQQSVFIEAMWAGAVHNLGIRMWGGTVWAFPSFWGLVKSLCRISGFSYEIIAPFEFCVYLLLTFILSYVAVHSRMNLDKRNLWCMAYLFLFSFMMFLPSAHEKWIYSSFPILLMAAVSNRKQTIIFLLIYLGLTFTLFEAIYGDCQYFFTSTHVLPMPRDFLYGGAFAEAWYHLLRWAAQSSARWFSQLPHAVFTSLLFFISLKEALTSHAPPRLKTRPGEASNIISQGLRQVNSSQTRLDRFHAPREEKRPVATGMPARHGEDVDGLLEDFRSKVKRLKKALLELEELRRLSRSGEVSENAYGLIVDELGKQISLLVEEIFGLRKMLELAKAKTKLRLAKEKTELEGFVTPESQEMLRMLGKAPTLRRELYSTLNRLIEVISNVDAALKSLTIEEEIYVLQQYLSLISEKSYLRTMSEEIEGGKRLCQQRLDLISEEWASTRLDKAKHVMDLEQRASRTNEEIKEIEARFALGEFDQNTFEYKLSPMRGLLENLEREIADTRRHIDEMDRTMFRCSELLRSLRA